MTAPRNPEIDGASPVAVEDASPPRSFLTGGASTPSAIARLVRAIVSPAHVDPAASAFDYSYEGKP